MNSEPEISISEINELLSTCPGLAESIGIQKSIRFIRITAALKTTILSQQAPSHPIESIPHSLPPDIHAFLGGAMGMSPEYITGCWDAFKTTVWDYNEEEHSKTADAKLFYDHASPLKIGRWHIVCC